MNGSGKKKDSLKSVDYRGKQLRWSYENLMSVLKLPNLETLATYPNHLLYSIKLSQRQSILWSASLYAYLGICDHLQSPYVINLLIDWKIRNESVKGRWMEN